MASLANMKKRKAKKPPPALYDQAEEKYGIPHGILRGIAQTESNENPEAVSPTGVVGLMGITRRTGHEYGLKDRDWKKPAEQIDKGANIIGSLWDRKGGDMAAALKKYGDPTDPAYAAKVLTRAGQPIPVDHPATSSMLPPDAYDPGMSRPSLAGMRGYDDGGDVGEGMPLSPEDRDRIRMMR